MSWYSDKFNARHAGFAIFGEYENCAHIFNQRSRNRYIYRNELSDDRDDNTDLTHIFEIALR